MAFALPPPPPAVVREVCNHDVCMPMRCQAENCTPVPPNVPMAWPDLLSRPRPKPSATLSYGAGGAHVVDLWLPASAGPHPVAVLIHGGCWTKSVADRTYFNYAAEDLRRHGVAVWNIEYRGVDEPGGGYPGTYQDVGAALDLLRTEAPRRGLKLDHVVAVGHSAGGQLALWAAARPKLPASSPLHVSDPLRIAAVVDLAGIPDLERDLHTACGAAPVQAMAGPERRGGRFADTSPAALLPIGVETSVLHGAQDATVPLAVGRAYAARAKAAGDTVVVLDPPGGHVEEVAPGAKAWDVARGLIVTAAGGAR